MRARHGLRLLEFSPGGGFAITSNTARRAPPMRAFADAIARAVNDGCGRYRLERPLLTVEPGRSIVSQAGVAVYRVGGIKVRSLSLAAFFEKCLCSERVLEFCWFCEALNANCIAI